MDGKHDSIELLRSGWGLSLSITKHIGGVVVVYVQLL